jgi:hypothetical protein
MRLVVAGDRLDPPIGIPAEVYELMLCCWNTEAESRPMFAVKLTKKSINGSIKFTPLFLGIGSHIRSPACG